MKQKSNTTNPLEDLELNEDIEQLVDSELTERDREELSNYQKFVIEFNGEYSSLCKSEFSHILFFLLHNLTIHGITKENYAEKTTDQNAIEFYALFFEIVDAFLNLLKPAYVSFALAEKHIYLSLNKKNKISGSFKEDLILIHSTLFDYHLFKKVKEMVLQSESKFVKEVVNTLPELIMHLENAITLFDIDREELRGVTLYITKGNLKGSKLKLTGGIIEKMIEPLLVIDELNTKFFDNSLSKDMLKQFLIIMRGIENDSEFSSPFVLFAELFKKEGLSLRARKLLIHDLLVIYGHSRALTSDNEDQYLKKTTTLEAFKKAKIRVVELLVPGLK
jgi:hypothetical protein